MRVAQTAPYDSHNRQGPHGDSSPGGNGRNRSAHLQQFEVLPPDAIAGESLVAFFRILAEWETAASALAAARGRQASSVPQ